ncbi:MAG TPA: lytic transglycosylase domain-containing protein [Saprospiraceae bacterium]|nr:lytic transglycosylase domain-containing protein [Saprospiraceae bacterium]
MEKKMYAFTSLMAGFFCLVIFSSFNKVNATVEDSTATLLSPSTATMKRVTGFNLHKEFAFAGEVLPTENFDARERLDRELAVNTYMESITLLNIKTANRYFPIIEPILKKNGIPDDFKFLCVAESNLRMATSPAGAKGLWQFIDSSGKAYGLEINSEVDERYNVEKSTEAACHFLQHLKDRFGSWTMAAAAYNMGPALLAKRVEEQQENDYYNLNLNEETSRYVFRIIAIKEIMKDPERFGFYVEPEQLYPPLTEYNTISIDGPIPSLSALAKQYGTTYRMLKLYNPWLIDTALTNKYKKHYDIRLPKQPVDTN